MPQTPDASGVPKDQARMTSGLPLPATTGSARQAPLSASFRISGSGLISLLSGMKPETVAPAGTATGNSRAAIASAACWRSTAASASRRAAASRRKADLISWTATMDFAVRHARPCAGHPRLASAKPKDVDGRDEPGHDQSVGVKSSAEPQRPLERRSRVPYESRWAPYVRTHEPGQGQLP